MEELHIKGSVLTLLIPFGPFELNHLNGGLGDAQLLGDEPRGKESGGFVTEHLMRH